MKKFALSAVGIAILLSGTPLTAAHQRRAECRIVHPAYYYRSQGRRFDRKFRRDHFLRFHASGLRFDRDRRRYDRGDRYRYRRYPSPDYRYRRNFERYRYHRFRHRPRIGVYLEF